MTEWIHSSPQKHIMASFFLRSFAQLLFVRRFRIAFRIKTEGLNFALWKNEALRNWLRS
jgi:hypothetical protein